MAIRGVITEFFSIEEFERQKKIVRDGVTEYIDLVNKAKPIRVDLKGQEGIKEIVKGVHELADVQKEQIKTSEKAADAARILAKAEIEGRVEKQKFNAELKREIELQNSQNGSLNEATALVKRLTAERNNLNLTTEEGRKKQQELNAQIDKANTFIKANVDAQKRQGLNVGNYEGSAKIIVDAFERARLKVDQVNKSFGATSPEAKAARAEFEALERITSQPQFLNISAKLGDANAELKLLTKSLIDLERNGQGNTQSAEDLRNSLVKLTKEVSDTRKEVKALSSDTRGFDLFAGAVSSVTSAFQTAAGVAQLFGDENEDVQKSIQRLVAIENVANGVRAIANELTTKGTAANKAYNFVIEQGSILFGKAATGAQRFGAALKLTGIGLAIGLISKLADTLGIFGRSNDDAADAVDRLTKKLQEQRRISQEINDNISTFSQITIERLKQVGVTEGQIFEQEQKARRKQLEVLNEDYKKALTDRDEIEKNAQEDLEKAQRLRDKKLINDIRSHYKNQKDLIQKEIEERGILVLNKENEITLSQEKERARLAEESRSADKKRAEEAAKKLEELQKKTEAERLRILEANRRAEFELLEIAAERRIRHDEKIANDEEQSLAIRLKHVVSYLINSRGLIEAEAKFEIATGNKTAKEIEVINARKEDKLLELADTGAKLRLQVIEQATEKEKKIFETVQNKYADIARQVNQSVIDANQKAGDAAAKRIADRAEATKKLVEELKGLVVDLFSADIEREKNEIQEEIDALEEKKQKDIEVANQTIANEKDKAAAIAVIEARAQAQREQLERKKRKLDEDKARFDKAKAIADIIQNTAVAILAALKEGNIALSVLAGIIGAAQLARVLATPIPKYKHGTKDHPGGLAIVGDGGKSERVITPEGKHFDTPTTPTVIDLPKRSVVLPDSKAVAIAAVSSIHRSNENQHHEFLRLMQLHQENKTVDAVKDIGNNIVSAIKKIPQPIIKVQNKLSHRIKYGDKTDDYLNQNLQG